MPVIRSYALVVCLVVGSTCLTNVVDAAHDLQGFSNVKPLPSGHGPMPIKLGKRHAFFFSVLRSEPAL